jgi:hypothetical protein
MLQSAVEGRAVLEEGKERLFANSEEEGRASRCVRQWAFVRRQAERVTLTPWPHPPVTHVSHFAFACTLAAPFTPSLACP